MLFWPKWVQFQDARASSLQSEMRIKQHLEKLSAPVDSNEALKYRAFVAARADLVRFRGDVQKQLSALTANSGARVLGLSVPEASLKEGLYRQPVSLKASGNLQVLLAIMQGLGAQGFPVLIQSAVLESQPINERRLDQNITLSLELVIWVEPST
jgi:hypothetical protein